MLPNSWLESKSSSQQIRFRTFSSLNLQTVLNLLYFYIKQKMILPNIKNRFLDPRKYIDELFRKRLCVQILNMKMEYLSGVETLGVLFSMYKKWKASKMFSAIYTNIDVQMLKLVTKAVPIYQLKREKCTNHLSRIASSNLKQIYLLSHFRFLILYLFKLRRYYPLCGKASKCLDCRAKGFGFESLYHQSLGVQWCRLDLRG